MKKSVCLAIDMGASNIRLIAGIYNNNKLTIEVTYRFNNNPQFIDGYYRWDINEIVSQIFHGIKKTLEKYDIESIGVNSWGVDYALLNSEKELVDLPISYRDSRTDNIEKEIEPIIPLFKIFEHTGINYNPFNTLYQLYSDKKIGRFEKASYFLMMASYINYKLCGVIENEMTLSSTTQLLNCSTGDWDQSIIEKLGLPASIFKKPGCNAKVLGKLVLDEIEYPTEVIQVPAHDSASAVFAVPAIFKNVAYISAGTWCVVGMLSKVPFITKEALNLGITNELAADGDFRILKNLTGLWIVQRLKEELFTDIDYEKINTLTRQVKGNKYIIDVNNPEFYNPDNMKEAIDSYLLAKYNSKPASDVEYFNCAYNSIADAIIKTINCLEEFNSKGFDAIHIIGGGSNSTILCQTIADMSGKKVCAGPDEAASIGNLLSQGIAINKIENKENIQEILKESFDIVEYLPN